VSDDGDDRPSTCPQCDGSLAWNEDTPIYEWWFECIDCGKSDSKLKEKHKP
jgi:hypothetical protein